MDIKIGYFIVDPQGRIGLCYAAYGHHVDLTYGSGGPFKTFLTTQLRYATEEEVERAGLTGVGGDVWTSYADWLAKQNRLDDAEIEGIKRKLY